MDPFSHRTVEELVAVAASGDPTVVSVDPIEAGTDALYAVGLADGRDWVCKAAAFVDPAPFRPEPYVIAALDDWTGVPVPSVVGTVDEHPELPAPAFVMERVPGETRPGARSLSLDAAERIARAAGRHLREIHDAFDFERFGGVRLGRDVENDRRAARVRGARLTTADDAHATFASYLGAVATFHLDRLADRFAGLEGLLREYVTARLAELDGAADPVYAHGDYRLGNLVLDGTETVGVVDFGNESTATRGYDVHSTELQLSGWAAPGTERRRRVSDALVAGYGEDPVPADRRELFEAVGRLPALAWFEDWHDGADASVREERAAEHRAAVEAALD